MASTMRLRLAITLDDNGVWDYLDDARLEVFTKVAVRVGFTGGGWFGRRVERRTRRLAADDGLERVFTGYITAVNPTWGSEPGSSHLEIEAMDTSVLMSLEEKIATWPNLSDSDIVQQIVSGYGVTANSRLDADGPSGERHDDRAAHHRHSVCTRPGPAQWSGVLFRD